MSEGPGAASGDRGATGGTPSQGEPAQGKRVGNYEVIRRIGRGGMATVYLARQETLDREVALKELSSFHADSPEMAERFLRESRLAGSLNHPNIVTVLEYFEEGGIPYIAMEYVRRGSLRPYVGRLPMAQFVGVMEGVLAGLAHAETLGIVHRDLKPENLMVTADGRIKITDFGIAKATLSAGTGGFLTAVGTTVGTPAYMAPEQAMGQEVGGWTDLYSVGIMAWEHVVGHVPFHDSDVPLVILTRHLNERIPSAIEVNPDADPSLSEWIDRLLVKDPRERAQSAAEVWEDLEDVILREQGPRWRRKARLPSPSQVYDTLKPLTPAPFESTKAKTPTPAHVPPLPAPPVPAESTAAETPEPIKSPERAGVPPAARGDSGYVTFGHPGEGEAAPLTPEPSRQAEPVPSERSSEAQPVGPAAAAAGAAAEAIVADESSSPAVAPTPPPGPAPAPPVSTYITFGATPESPVEAEEPETVAHEEPATATAEPTEEAESPAPGPDHPLTAEDLGAPTMAPSFLATAPEPEIAEPEVAEPEVAEPEVAATEAVEPLEPERRRVSTSALAIAGAVVAAIVAAIVGFAVAPTSTKSAAAPPAPTKQTLQPPLAISSPASWERRAAPALSYLKLSNEIALAPTNPAGGLMVVGTANTSDPSLLPASLISAVGTSGRQVVALAPSGRFYRYEGLTPDAGSNVNVYALPTTAGVVIAACLIQGSAPSFPALCERSVGSLRLTSGSVLPLGPSPKFATGLSGVIAKLKSATTSGMANLRHAGKPGEQAKAATQLGSAYTEAASAVQQLQPGPVASTAAAALATALHQTAKDYDALAAAASHSNGGAYGRAQSALASDAGTVNAAFGQLAKLGYVSS